MKYNAHLDSLRAIAALAVIGFHWKGVFLPGWIGVQLFFVLSGFLITTILLENREKIGSLSEYTSIFFRRRILRLFPLYYLFLSLWTISYVFSGFPEEFRRDWVWLYTYSLNIGRMMPGYSDYMGYSHLWSLGCEWQFYLIWPFVIWFVPKNKVVGLFLVAILAAPLLRYLTFCWAAHVVNTGPYPNLLTAWGNFTYNAPWTQLDAFAFGGLLTIAKVRKFAGSKLVVSLIFGVTALAGLLVMILGHKEGLLSFRTLGYPVLAPYYLQSMWGYTLLNGCCAVLIAMVAEGARFCTIVTGFGWLQYLGKISYGIYVWHAPLVYWVCEKWLSTSSAYSFKSLILLLCTTGVVVIFAHVSYVYFESFFLRLKKKVHP